MEWDAPESGCPILRISKGCSGPGTVARCGFATLPLRCAGGASVSVYVLVYVLVDASIQSGCPYQCRFRLLLLDLKESL